MILKLPWETGAVPAAWKLANIVLIAKKGEKKDPGNNRPGILTSVLILGHIEKHLENNEVIGHIVSLVNTVS